MNKRVLAIDLGLARTGIAVSETGSLASPLVTIIERNADRLLDKICAVIDEQKPATVVVGHPRNMDGSCGESAQRAEQLAESIRSRTAIPTVLQDERMTTVTAIHYLNQSDVRGKKRKAVVDSVAATIILQDYLETQLLSRRQDDDNSDKLSNS